MRVSESLRRMSKASPTPPETIALDALEHQPITVREPERHPVPVLVASPHSGRLYPKSFLFKSRLAPWQLRQSEDFWVDELVKDTGSLGCPLITARFPRAYLDVNREAYELDPRMFRDPLPAHVNARSLRVAGGLGTIARIVNDGEEIYAEKLVFADAERRIDKLYRPYHEALADQLTDLRARFGYVVFLDCHSMPSQIAYSGSTRRRSMPDFVLGDRYGTACPPELTERIERFLGAQGFSVARNVPYAGGFCTEHYGRPDDGIMALQIEINRACYMDEKALVPSANFPRLKALMFQLVKEIVANAPLIAAANLNTPRAAE